MPTSIFRSGLCAVFVLGAVASAPAALEPLGGVGGASNTVVVGGDRLYATEGITLQVWDLNPTTGAPETRRGTVGAGNNPVDLVVVGNLAYLLDFSGLNIINVANPDAPALVKRIETGAAANDLAIQGGRAYVADFDAGVSIIDVSTPAASSIVGHLAPTGYPAFVEADASGHIYLGVDTDTGGYFQVVNVADASSPSVLAQTDLAGYPSVLRLKGSSLIVGIQSGGLNFFDVSDPAHPAAGAALATPSAIISLTVTGDRAFGTANLTGILAFDFNTPATPLILGTFAPGFATIRGTALRGDVIYAAATGSGLFTVDASNPAAMSTTGNFARLSQAYAVAASGDTSIYSNQAGGFTVVDHANPAAPLDLGDFATDEHSQAVAFNGTLALIERDPQALQIYNMAVPSAPNLLSTYQSSGTVRGIALAGNLAYLAMAPARLEILDISAPAAPALLGAADTTGGLAYGCVVVGTTAYMPAGEAGLRIFNVSDASSPALIGTFTTGSTGFGKGAAGVAIDGTRAYVAYLGEGMFVLDVTNPAAPTQVANIKFQASANGIALSGDRAFIANSYQGLTAVDISNPAAPALLESALTGGSANSVAVQGDVIHVAAGSGGGRLFRYSTGPTTVTGSQVVNHILGKMLLTGPSLAAADANADAVVDIADALGLFLGGQ